MKTRAGARRNTRRGKCRAVYLCLGRYAVPNTYESYARKYCNIMYRGVRRTREKHNNIIINETAEVAAASATEWYRPSGCRQAPFSLRPPCAATVMLPMVLCADVKYYYARAHARVKPARRLRLQSRRIVIIG